MKDQKAIRKGKGIAVQKAPMNSASFKTRCLTVQTKASQLSTLCDVDVCVICYARDGTLFTWPEDRTAAREIALKFKRLGDKTKSKKRRIDLAGFLKKIQDEEEKKSGGKRSKFPSWDKSLDGCSKEKLMELESSLLSEIQKLEERCELLKQQKEQEKEMQLVEFGRKEELVYQLPAPATDDQNHNLSELTGNNNNNISTLVEEIDSDFEAWFHKSFPQEASSSNINPNIQFQNQGLNYSDMNVNNISNVNALVPVNQIAVNGDFMVPQGYNYSQSLVPQTHYQNLSAQMIGTPSSYNYLHPVHMQNSRISWNNNVAPMGTIEDFYMNGISQSYGNFPFRQ